MAKMTRGREHLGIYDCYLTLMFFRFLFLVKEDDVSVVLTKGRQL